MTSLLLIRLGYRTRQGKLDAGADPRICERGAVPPVPFLSHSCLFFHLSSPSLPSPLEVGPFKPAIECWEERCKLPQWGQGRSPLAKTNFGAL